MFCLVKILALETNGSGLVCTPSSSVKGAQGNSTGGLQQKKVYWWPDLGKLVDMKIWHYDLSLATWKSGTITFLWARIETANRNSCWGRRYQRFLFFLYLQLGDWMQTIAGYAFAEKKYIPVLSHDQFPFLQEKILLWKNKKEYKVRLPMRNPRLDELTLDRSHMKCIGFFLVYGSTFYLNLWVHMLQYWDCCYSLNFLMIEGWNGYFVLLCVHHFYCLLNIIMSLNSLRHLEMLYNSLYYSL